MITTVNTFKLNGIETVPITVECNITPGVGIHLVGLADAAVKESLLRTVTALLSNGYSIPGKKIVINITPADLRKSGSGYDLPIALGIIAASGRESLPDLDKYVFSGELGLDGSIRNIPGWIQGAELAASLNRCPVLPAESARLAAEALGEGSVIYGVGHLSEAIEIAKGNVPDHTALDEVNELPEAYSKEFILDYRWDDIKGHAAEKLALEIAAAGGHPLLLMGNPGSGRMDLARAIVDIMPPLTGEEAMEVQRVYASKGDIIAPGRRPVRIPHYSSSLPSLLGGGTGENIVPGEVSLADKGVLVLNDFVMMPKCVTEALRGPFEDKSVTISRLKSKVTYPADFFPVVISDPCPCGHYGEGDRCTCTPNQRALYLGKLDGPIYDRLTMQVWVHASYCGETEPAHLVAERVRKARVRQMDRQGKLNDDLTAEELYSDEMLFNVASGYIDRLGLSARASSRILKIARTIADLDERDIIAPSDIAEASAFRFLDRIVR